MPSFALFLFRFLKNPKQVASIIPASRGMVRRIADKMDLARPCVVVEYGPGEGTLTREMLKRAHPESKFLLFELDPEFCRHLRSQFANDERVTIIQADCVTLPQQLAQHHLAYCDYVVSSIPFSTMEIGKKREILRHTHDSLAPAGKFVTFQFTNELVRFSTPGIFPRAESEIYFPNIPPNFIAVFHKNAEAAGHGTPDRNVSGRSARNHNAPSLAGDPTSR